MFDLKEGSKGKEKTMEKNVLMKRANTLDEGVVAFGEWLMSVDNDPARSASCGPLSLKKFVADEYAVLMDASLGEQVVVEIVDGIPECKKCADPDCMHIGFTICASQMMNRRNGMVNFT
ncbi:hypothetical protein NTE_00200 [Candidatus Nitrososphaera evergladensis SR1]|jgi:hypothetical protein|uniref:Uncharacterized protein n=1 Tax=Candidatus Nitrososphaera evergladensis SR1 TaxID=1459636 RepID=A0A075MNA3_9ARCH|nr:hypothetical protein [Candidatus Nitrososphaera evergladensis]AIF82282.1 hypothetical protein NTE_00200 [Candidatus Nitrososphaera evergladensis SR1]